MERAEAGLARQFLEAELAAEIGIDESEHAGQPSSAERALGGPRRLRCT
jgi:hypothetical protein